MSKDESSAGKDNGGELIATDPDPVQLGETDTATESGNAADTASEVNAAADAAAEREALEIEVDDTAPANESVSAPPPPPPKPRRSWFGLFNFVLILALAGAAGYYWWLEQQAKKTSRTEIDELRAEIGTKANSASVEASVDPLRAEMVDLEQKISVLETGQQSLQASSEKLYELYGRDKNDWQLAEVEYLIRVAQHKLILQDDFEGAAITLQAASDKIALTGDPGLLPVRLKISDEIADLKTRKRADLVGMTLILAQLGRQVHVLEPGFEPRVDSSAPTPPPEEAAQDWLGKVDAFVDSLVEIRIESAEPTEIEANVANVGETLADNLKLARWAVLERDARQYADLIDQSLRLFREFYDLDNAANGDFFRQLQDLRKMQLRPEKPDITGSLRELQRILARRDSEPEAAPGGEITDG